MEIKKENLSTRELIYELQEKLVQTCIDFINEKGLCDVQEIHFRADCLQESAKYKQWMPCTDSCCEFFKVTNNGTESIDYSA